jgi:orotate phosphoribosyltransferase
MAEFPDKKEELVLGLYEREIIKFGEFTLKSGRKSPIYYNQRPLLSVDRNLQMIPARQKKVAQLAVQGYAYHSEGHDTLYGIPQAATAIGALVAHEIGASYIWGRVGKKEYGKHEAVEGDFQNGDLVLQLDDVVTDAGSKIDSAANLTEAGLRTDGFVVMLDRQEGGKQALAEAGHSMHSVITMSEVALILNENNVIGAQEIEDLQAYHEDLRDEGIHSSFNYNG